MDGDASGEEGLVIGKFDNYVLVHFEDEVLEKLTIGRHSRPRQVESASR